MIRNLKESLYKRLYSLPMVSQLITRHFHRLYYYSPERTWQNTFWLGTPASKLPLDLWVYQELIYNEKPDVSIECGTNRGGSALYFASIFDLVKKGRILTIDIEDFGNKPTHERITYLSGSSTSDAIVNKVRDFISEGEKVIVVLDSDHSMKHVLNELRIYSEIVTPGSYLIVEDSNVNGYPVVPRFGPGPMEAINTFIDENDNYAVEADKEKFYFTFNPKGYLKRVK
jgi:cephalosporin hydroxylase